MHQLLNCVQPFATLWTIACQAPLSMGFSRQEHGNGLPCPSPGDLPPPRYRIRVSWVFCIGRWVLSLLGHQGNPGLLYFFSIEGEGTAGRDWLVDNAWEGRSSKSRWPLLPGAWSLWSKPGHLLRTQWGACQTGLVSGAIGNRPPTPHPWHHQEEEPAQRVPCSGCLRLWSALSKKFLHTCPCKN